LAAIEARMREIAASNAPIEKERVPLDQAVEFFRTQGDAELVRLLSHRHHKDYLVLYTLRGVRSVFHGYMVPSAGYLGYFGLYHYPPGFILRFPPRHCVDLEPVVEYPKLIHVFREYGKTLRLLGVENVGALDEAVVAGRTNEIILVAEALHEQRIARIATHIAERAHQGAEGARQGTERAHQGAESARQGSERAHAGAGGLDAVRLVLIAGPSASGKTTFSKRLAVQLLANGIRPIAVELDSYFVDRELTPRDDKGNFNFEVLEALDLPFFNRQLLQLMAGEEVTLPKFDFVAGVSVPGATIQLGPDQVLIVEGIHGLNPRLTAAIPAERVYRIYASALTQLNIDRYNRVPTTDTRLLRRIVRDARARGYTAADTITRWESVHRGEREHIFPYQENADAMFNSALAYELGVLKPFAEPLLLQIEPGKPGYIEAKRLLAFLAWFDPIPVDPIPDNSILREFVGGSNLEKFEPWRKG